MLVQVCASYRIDRRKQITLYHMCSIQPYEWLAGCLQINILRSVNETVIYTYIYERGLE